MLGTNRAHLRDATYILELLLLQLVPYFAARAFGRYRPALGERIGRIAGRVATTAALGLLAFLLAHRALRTTALLGARGWLAVLLFGIALLVLGWISGGRRESARRTFAVTNEARNLALALVVANNTVHDQTTLLALFAAWLVLFGFGVVATLGARRLPVPSARLDERGPDRRATLERPVQSEARPELRHPDEHTIGPDEPRQSH
jgi:hypothetical protein